ncbi:cyclin-dependent kinase inhibitor 1B [Hyla sarda]|uniref:cyclin-dependent kinase inhibitor 1B n=1 Tax=Hyla sarda TaxID=327740 RepID=UPI0024C33386|nr:cyclin-dependent kinase inhibitor 1B [Hyla sarda]
MSGVRLSPGSPGVERVSRAPGSPRTPARRCLFGPVDHESLARELARCRRELEDEQRERWNFDFCNERPLDGALSWEVAGPDTPEFYRRGPHLKAGAAQLHPQEEPEARGKKRSGEVTEPPSSNARKSHRSEPGESAEGSSSPSPEKTPKKSRPST